MSLPVLHSLAGYGAHRLGSSSSRYSSDRLFLVYCLLLANLPDLDFIPGVLTGCAGDFHRSFTHSLGAAVLAAFTGAGFWYLWKKREFFKTFLISFIAYSSHLFLDFWGKSPKGQPLLWPLSDQAITGPLTDYSLQLHQHPLETASGLGAFLSALVHPDVLQSWFLEITVLLFVWTLITIFNPRETERRGLEQHVFARGALAAVCMVFCILLK